MWVHVERMRGSRCSEVKVGTLVEVVIEVELLAVDQVVVNVVCVGGRWYRGELAEDDVDELVMLLVVVDVEVEVVAENEVLVVGEVVLDLVVPVLR